MKSFFLFAFLLILSFDTFSSNPGANYGCLSYGGNPKLYTNYIYTDNAPGNPYWGPFHYYDTMPQVYDVNYNTQTPPCGQVNPSQTLQSTGQECFIKIGNTFQQGGLRTFSSGSVVPCPIDNSVWMMVFSVSLLVLFKIYDNSNIINTKTS